MSKNKLEENNDDFLNEEVQQQLLQVINEEVKKEEEENLEDTLTIPKPTDPEYSDFILSQFTSNEVVVKYNPTTKEETARFPKVNGLRRIAKLHIGTIVESYPTAISVNYNLEAGFVVACFSYTVVFKLKDDSLVRYSDVGEIVNFPGDKKKFTNIDPQFGRFASSIAVTRAEARTLRKALGLNTVAYEELDMEKEKEKEKESHSDEQPAYIKDVQKQSIKVFCKRHGIDVNKYIKSGPYNYDNLDKVSFSHAATMWQQLEEFQRKTKDLEAYKKQYNLSIDTNISNS